VASCIPQPIWLEHLLPDNLDLLRCWEHGLAILGEAHSFCPCQGVTPAPLHLPHSSGISSSSSNDKLQSNMQAPVAGGLHGAANIAGWN
jgi:hypothetical protein